MNSSYRQATQLLIHWSLLTLAAICLGALVVGCGQTNQAASPVQDPQPAASSPATNNSTNTPAANPTTTANPVAAVALPDWSRFLGPTFDGKSSETGILTDWDNAKLPLLWSAAVGTSYGIGSVADNRYIQHERAGEVERLRALNADTGQTLWQNDHPVQYQDMYGYNDGPRDTPAIVGDQVYTLGVAGRLTCVNLRTGETVWQLETNTKYGVVQNFFGVGSSPLVVDDLVIVMVGGSPEADQQIAPGQLDRVSPNGSALVALDRHTGTERWRAGDDLASYSSPRLMTIEGQRVVIAFCRDGLLGVQLETGKVLWQFHHRADLLESVNGMTPVVLEDQIFISDCYGVGSVLLQPSLEDCRVVWQDPPNRREHIFRAHWATPIAIGDYLFGSSGRNEPDSDLRCINWKTRQLQWNDNRRSRCSLLAVDNHLVVLDESGELELIKADATQLQTVTRLNLEDGYGNCPPLGTPYWAAPIISQGRLYIRGSQGVACFRLIAPRESTD